MSFIGKRSIDSITVGGQTIYGGSIELNIPGGSLDPATGEIVIPTGSAGTVETFNLDATDLANKYIVLTTAPTVRTNTRLEIRGFGPQFYNDDFTVTDDDGGKRVSWDSLNLDGLLIVGDLVSLTYN